MAIPQNYPITFFDTTNGNSTVGAPVLGVANQVTVNYKEGVSIVSIDGYTVLNTQFDKTNTTLATVTGMSYTVLPATKYKIDLDLFLTLGAGAGKVAIGGTATATSFRIAYPDVISAAYATSTVLGTAVTIPGSGFVLASIKGYILTNAGGTLLVQFAQNTASGTSSVLVGSTCKLTQVV